MPGDTFPDGTFDSLLSRASAYSPEVAERLRWLAHFRAGKSVSATCRAFGIARTTFYRWAKRFDPNDLSTLQDAPTFPLPNAARAAVALSAPVALPAEEPVALVPTLAHPDIITIRFRFPAVIRRMLGRSVIVASIVANLVFFAAVIGTGVLEARLARDTEHAAAPSTRCVRTTQSSTATGETVLFEHFDCDDAELPQSDDSRLTLP